MVENEDLGKLLEKNFKDKDKYSIEICVKNCKSPIRPSRISETLPEVQNFLKNEKKLTAQDIRSIICMLQRNNAHLDKIDRAAEKYMFYLELYVASYWSILKPILYSVRKEKQHRENALTFEFQGRTIKATYQPKLNLNQKRKDQECAQANARTFIPESQQASVLQQDKCTLLKSQKQEESEFSSSASEFEFFDSFYDEEEVVF